MKLHLIAVYIAWFALVVTGVAGAITSYSSLFPDAGPREMLPNSQESMAVLLPPKS